MHVAVVRQPQQDLALEPVGVAEEDAVRTAEVGDEAVARAVRDEPAANLDERLPVGGL